MKKVLAGCLFYLWSAMSAAAGVTCTVPFNLQNNTLADATQVMANFNALVTCFTNAAAAGANNDITALLALATPISPTLGGSSVYTAGASTGTANAQIVASPNPTGFTLTRGNSVLFVAGLTNTGAMTLAVNGTTATNVFRSTPNGPQALTGGEVIANNTVWAVYDGTQYQIISNGAQFGGYGPLLSVSSAGTVDLGTVPTHNVLVTGAITITSLGSTASTTYPIYKLAFSGAPLLTYNATSLILPGGRNIQAAANDTAEALYLGSGNWQIISYTPASGLAPIAQLPRAGFDQLTLANGASNTTITWSYNNAQLVDSAGRGYSPHAPQTNTVNISTGTGGTSTAGGMDGNAPGNNQMVAIWAIFDGTNWQGVGTKSAYPTLPTLPAGYFAAGYMGSFKTNGSGNLYGELIVGNEANYVVGGANLGSSCPAVSCVLPQLSTGTQGSNCSTASITYQTLTVRGNSGAAVWMPSSAVVGVFSLSGAAGGNSMVTSNGSYTGGAGLLFTSTLVNVLGRFGMEANTIFYCSAAGASVLAQYGWKDIVNAN